MRDRLEGEEETMLEVCNRVRDLLPALVAGSLERDRASSLQDHLRRCEDCRQELEIIQRVRESLDVKVPDGLEARIQARIREEMTVSLPNSGEGKIRKGRGVFSLGGRRVWRRAPAWALSAAAVLVLALGIRLLGSMGTGDPTLDTVVVAAQEPIPEAWLWDDGFVAGAPVFDDLSEEDLEELLKEYEG